MRALTAVVTALTVATAATALTAQSDSRLQTAIRLAQAGRQDSALAVVSRLLATLTAADSVYPEALYTAGILALEARAITTNLQRVAVEYPRSAWADDALLRLVQFHFAQGDDAAAVQVAERLRVDYPDSPLRARAGFWGGRSYFNLRDESKGCALVHEALAGAGDDVEFRNQVAFYASRCPPPLPAPADTAQPSAPADSGARLVYAVQVLAVRSAAQVDEMLTRLRVMGFDARVVRDTSGLFKVRVGRYATREEAQRAQARLRTRLGGQPFIVEER